MRNVLQKVLQWMFPRMPPRPSDGGARWGPSAQEKMAALRARVRKCSNVFAGRIFFSVYIYIYIYIYML